MLLPWRRKPTEVGTRPKGLSAEQSLRLRRIFDDTHDLAWRLLRRFGIPAELVEDSFQQVYLITSERLDEIRLGSERSFVYGVALRLARTYLRTRWREEPDGEPDLRPGAELGAEALMDRNQFIEICDRILDCLSPDLREVFVLHEIEGLTGIELSRLLEIPEGTVHSRLRRARVQVRAQVQALSDSNSSAEVGRG